MAVARPSGSVENYPKQEDLAVFEIPHGSFVAMKEGTWHAGPYFFGSDLMDFYSLKLEDTNVLDHNTRDYKRSNNGLEFDIVPSSS